MHVSVLAFHHTRCPKKSRSNGNILSKIHKNMIKQLIKGIKYKGECTAYVVNNNPKKNIYIYINFFTLISSWYPVYTISWLNIFKGSQNNCHYYLILETFDQSWLWGLCLQIVIVMECGVFFFFCKQYIFFMMWIISVQTLFYARMRRSTNSQGSVCLGVLR